MHLAKAKDFSSLPMQSFSIDLFTKMIFKVKLIVINIFHSKCSFIQQSVAYNRSSAPKDCRVSGWLKGQDGDVAADSDRRFLLTEFIYDLDKSNVQTFNVIDSGSPGLVNMIRLDFTSNHGHSAHTCIYRLRVHGHEPSSVLMFTTQA